MLLVLDNFDVYTIGLSLRELRYGTGAVDEKRGSDVRVLIGVVDDIGSR